jgi:hypothetical protein
MLRMTEEGQKEKERGKKGDVGDNVKRSDRN